MYKLTGKQNGVNFDGSNGRSMVKSLNSFGRFIRNERCRDFTWNLFEMNTLTFDELNLSERSKFLQQI